MIHKFQLIVFLLVFTVSNLLRYSTALSQSCPPGNFIQNGECKTCRIGTFNEKYNSTFCIRCYTGTFYPFSGAQSSENCLPCASGTYSDMRGVKSCRPCPHGTYSQGGASKCLKCKPGTGLDSWSNYCSPCYAGFFNDGTFKYCRRCPSGTVASKPFGATKCTPCPKGMFRDMRYISRIDRWKCQPCPKNTYSDKQGTQQCALCPLGMISNSGSDRCMPCPKNMFRAGVKRMKCIPCPPGTSSNGGPSAACKHPIKGCPFDTFQDKKGTCRACLPGERLDVAAKTCVKCNSDEASRGGATTTCIKCTDNTAPASDISVYERSQCRCKLGFTRGNDGTCEPCPAGQYGTERPAGALWHTLYRYFNNRQPHCTSCDPGSFSSPGSTKCTLCPKGYIAPGYGSEKCKKCQRGSRPNEVNEAYYDGSDITNAAYECKSIRHNCALGQVRLGSDCKVKRCLWPEKMTKWETCSSCDSYERWNEKEKDCETCRGILVNEVTRPHTRQRCTLCQNNAQVQKGKCVCKDGYIRVGLKCKRCPGGSVFKAGTCVKCANGVTWRDGGVSKYRCGFCRGNSFLPDGAKKCVPCPTGYKKMYDVVGNAVNLCRPIDPYMLNKRKTLPLML